jgi:tRNA(Ile)-lysidine synthase
VVRPLLGFRRAALQEFLREQGQSWREDSSNRELAFLRNRVRHRLLPMITEEFGEAAIEHMAELAEIARAEEQWAVDSVRWSAGPQFAALRSTESTAPGAGLDVERLLALPLAAQRRLVRAWLEANAPRLPVSFRLIEQALELAAEPAGRKVEMPSGWHLQRTRQALRLEFEDLNSHKESLDYQYTLVVPGSIRVPELGASVEARVVDAVGVPEKEREQLLDPRRMPKEVLIRNWRPGDRYWPAHTATEKKVKELLSGRHASGTLKKLWPVAVAEGYGLVWMRGFAVPAALRAPDGAGQAIWIREIAGMM